MVRNLFEEVALAQQKEELTRIRIYAKIKAKDIKGAHKLAKPYLKKISERKNNGEVIPTGWVKIAQTFCAIDIEKYGIDGTQESNTSREYPKENTWIEVALNIAISRLRGLMKSIVPASMAIALIAQVLQPMVSKAEGPKTMGVTPDGITLHKKTTGPHGNLEVSVSSGLPIQGDPEINPPELEWCIEDKGDKNNPDGNTAKLTGYYGHYQDGETPRLAWSLNSISTDPETGLVRAKIRVENKSNEVVPISQLSMSDSRYEGCIVAISDSIFHEYGPQRCPSEIGPNQSAIYEVSIAKEKAPSINFQSGDGEIHNLVLEIPWSEKDRKLDSGEDWVTLRAENTGYIPVELIAEKDNIEVKKGDLLNNQETLTKTTTLPITLNPGQFVSMTIKNIETGTMNLGIKTISRDGEREYKLRVSDPKTIKEKMVANYQRWLNLLLGGSHDTISWEGIKTGYEKEVPNLVKEVTHAPEGGKLMSTLVNQSAQEGLRLEAAKKFIDVKLPETIKTSKSTEVNTDLLKIEGVVRIVDTKGQDPFIKAYIAIESKRPISIKNEEDKIITTNMVQLAVIDGANRLALEKMEGKEVVLMGRPMIAHTSHHHTPILLWVEKMMEKNQITKPSVRGNSDWRVEDLLEHFVNEENKQESLLENQNKDILEFQ